jgi:Zn-dependent M28 family amino/carboxypeptidase
MRKPLLLASTVLAAALASAAFAQSEKLPPTPIDPAKLSQHDKILSSDEFEGRGPATRAEPKVIDYVVSQYKALGLQPAGDDGGWTQAVPMRRFELTGPVVLTLREGGKTVPLAQGEQMVAMTEVPVAHVAIKDAPLVFVGYGVKAPERRWDDFKGVDLHGKIMVVLINDPDFEADKTDGAYGKFDGKSMTYYGRWTYKFEEAARQGAAGILIVHETAPAAYGWAIVKNSNTIPQFDIVREEPTKSHPLLQGWLQRDVAADLFKSAGLDFDALKKAARQADFKPVEIKGAAFSADYGVKTETIVSHNILAKLTGKTKPNQTILYSAHWDHLGIGPADAKGDTIYNGALDNASGVAGMLEIARVFAKAPRTERTVAFMAVTAEEKGLLGSEYYGLHPIFPLATTVANLNLDGVQVAGPARNIEVQGIPKNTLVDMLEAGAKKEGRYLSPDAHPEQGHFFRADHFSLAKVGVPAVTLGGGNDLYKGGVLAGEAADKEYVAHHYHQPADEWDPKWDWRGGAVDLGLYYDLGRRLANSDIWPSWHADSEFKARRDVTAADRK